MNEEETTYEYCLHEDVTTMSSFTNIKSKFKDSFTNLCLKMKFLDEES